MNDSAPPKEQGRPPAGTGKEESYFPGDVNSIEKVRAAAKELERIREFLLQLTCRGPESYSALTRPAAQIDKAYRLIKEFIEPKARPERWRER